MKKLISYAFNERAKRSKGRNEESKAVEVVVKRAKQRKTGMAGGEASTPRKTRSKASGSLPASTT